MAVAAALAATLAVTGCTGSSKAPPVSASAGPTDQTATAGSPPVAGQAPVPAESNPPGDIPDNQAFVTFKPTGGAVALKIPEGWARADNPSGVTFTDHLNTIGVTWQTATTPPSTARATAQDVPELQRTQLAFTLVRVTDVKLPGGSAVRIESQENSQANAVTGKQYRLDVLRYGFFHNGQQAVLLLSSPVGADNVDPWKIVSESFRWL
jgi:hypothetical protein